MIQGHVQHPFCGLKTQFFPPAQQIGQKRKKEKKKGSVVFWSGYTFFKCKMVALTDSELIDSEMGSIYT